MGYKLHWLEHQFIASGQTESSSQHPQTNNILYISLDFKLLNFCYTFAILLSLISFSSEIRLTTESNLTAVFFRSKQYII